MSFTDEMSKQFNSDYAKGVARGIQIVIDELNETYFTFGIANSIQDKFQQELRAGTTIECDSKSGEPREIIG